MFVSAGTYFELARELALIRVQPWILYVIVNHYYNSTQSLKFSTTDVNGDYRISSLVKLGFEQNSSSF